MGMNKKSQKIYHILPNKQQKKSGISIWRYTFSGTNKETGVESYFFIEFEFLNPLVTPNEVQLGFKSRPKIEEEDLQYALAGTASASELQTERLVVPSYAAVRVGLMGKKSKQLCSYFKSSDVEIKQHPFEIKAGNTIFSETTLTGFINISESDMDEKPELMSNTGYASWNIDFDITTGTDLAYNKKNTFWCPLGLRTNMTGEMNFDGIEYAINARNSFGYIDKYIGKDIAEPLVHISSSNLQSIISGRTLFDSSIAVHGNFDGKLSVLVNVEGSEIYFPADSSKCEMQWECCQTPETEEIQKLHWSVSCNDKNWIVDIDLFCKVDDLYNRKIELPEGKRVTLSEVMSSLGYGEIKIYRRAKKVLEQIEYIRIAKALCEFGHKDNSELI